VLASLQSSTFLQVDWVWLAVEFSLLLILLFPTSNALLYLGDETSWNTIHNSEYDDLAYIPDIGLSKSCVTGTLFLHL